MNGHEERDEAAAGETNGNGRTGLQLKLTVKQITAVIGLAVTIATGVVAMWTREPTKTEHRQTLLPVDASIDAKLDALARALQAQADELAEIKSDGRDTREQMRELRSDVREVQGRVRNLEVQAANR